MGLVCYAMAASTWNTGEVASAKIEAQPAADSAAYSSALWMSRGVNLITSTNMHAMRDASAAPLMFAIGGHGVLTFGILVVRSALAVIQSLNPFTLAAGLAQLALLATEWGLWFDVYGDLEILAFPPKPIAHGIEIVEHIGELKEFQDEVVSQIPGIISRQAEKLGDYYDCDIVLQQGNGNTSISAPLHEGTPSSCLVPGVGRSLYDVFGKGSFDDENKEKFALMTQSSAKTSWKIASALAVVASPVTLGLHHHVLSSQDPWSPVEIGPFGPPWPVGPQTWADYTVIASATKRGENRTSGQSPRLPLSFMAAGVFDDPVRPVAYAQAETFNGVDGLMGTLNIGGFSVLNAMFALYPWRVWTDWGWRWEPRLTHGNLIQGGVFGGNTGVPAPVFGDPFREDVTTH